MISGTTIRKSQGSRDGTGKSGLDYWELGSTELLAPCAFRYRSYSSDRSQSANPVASLDGMISASWPRPGHLGQSGDLQHEASALALFKVVFEWLSSGCQALDSVWRPDGGNKVVVPSVPCRATCCNATVQQLLPLLGATGTRTPRERRMRGTPVGQVLSDNAVREREEGFDHLYIATYSPSACARDCSDTACRTDRWELRQPHISRCGGPRGMSRSRANKSRRFLAETGQDLNMACAVHSRAWEQGRNSARSVV